MDTFNIAVFEKNTKSFWIMHLLSEFCKKTVLVVRIREKLLFYLILIKHLNVVRAIFCQSISKPRSYLICDKGLVVNNELFWLDKFFLQVPKISLLFTVTKCQTHFQVWLRIGISLEKQNSFNHNWATNNRLSPMEWV